MVPRGILILLTLFCAGACRAQGSLAAADAVLQREMPHLPPQIHLTLQAGDYAGKSDGFRITGTQGDIHVQAATVPTLLFGVNWYLKYTAHLNVSTNGSQLGAPGLQLPAVPTLILRPALYFDGLDTALATGASPQPIDWYAFGDAWNRSSTQFASEPAGDVYRESTAIADTLGLTPKADQ